MLTMKSSNVQSSACNIYTFLSMLLLEEQIHIPVDISTVEWQTHSLTPSISIEDHSGLSTHHDPASGSSARRCLPNQCPSLGYLSWTWLVALRSSFHGWVPTRLMRMLWYASTSKMHCVWWMRFFSSIIIYTVNSCFMFWWLRLSPKC